MSGGTVAVSRETQARLEQFVSLLLKWNRTINLVSRQDRSLIWSRHVADSLRLAPLVSDEVTVADLGSGGGFPGFVLALVTGRPMVLVESDARKAAFLRQASVELDCRVTVHCARVERLAPLSADVLTARALAPLELLLAYALPHLARGGRCLFLKGENWRDEVRAAQRAWSFDVVPLTSPNQPGVVLQVERLAPRP